jgi:MalT-like TPR region
MDPTVRASESLLAHLKTFWLENGGRVAPLVAGSSERSAVVQALRQGELDPDNLRPFIVYEGAFTDIEPYCEGLIDQIERDYEALRAALAVEGVALPAFSTKSIAVDPIDRAAFAMQVAFALLVHGGLDGPVVALVPERVDNPERWRRCVTTLDSMARPPRLQLAVFAPWGGALEGTLIEPGPRFWIDGAQLFADLELPGRATLDGEPPGVRRAVYERLVIVHDLVRAGQYRVATLACREARDLCAPDQLALEDAAVLVLLGGICLSQHNPEGAIEHYRKAGWLAETERGWVVAFHAWLGVGAAYRVQGLHEPAAGAYRAAESAARSAKRPTLCVEALRMVGETLLTLGAIEDAIEAWRDALQIAASLNEEDRRRSGCGYIKRALGALHRRGHPRALLAIVEEGVRDDTEE